MFAIFNDVISVKILEIRIAIFSTFLEIRKKKLANFVGIIFQRNGYCCSFL